jgi:alkanesulfonate monooxygenase SsuD/methylene tetrahydromethanopterin reductase-like flavin-dependent oxidoreductase (luciferase family)
LTSQLRLGIQTVPNQPWETMVANWRLFEEMGFDSLWLPDHFVPTFRRDLPFFEAWTLLAGLAFATSRVRLGILVTCNTFRHPALLAKEAATVDHISNGRLEFGLGTGWVEFEHEMFGIPYPDGPERVSRFAEAVELIDLLMRQEVSNYSGAYYQLKDASFRPQPVQKPRPPFTLAAHSPRMLGIVARYADRWNSMGNVEELTERMAHLDDACDKAGRDPKSILRSSLYVPAIVPSEQPWDSIEAFRDYLGRYQEAGFGECLFQPPTPEQWPVLEKVAADILPALTP